MYTVVAKTNRKVRMFVGLCFSTPEEWMKEYYKSHKFELDESYKSEYRVRYKLVNVNIIVDFTLQKENVGFVVNTLHIPDLAVFDQL